MASLRWGSGFPLLACSECGGLLLANTILRRACGRAANIDNDFTSYNTSEVIDPVITEDIRGGAESGLLRAM
jgi:hypothetical protein